MVRGNAALSLVRFGDASGRPQLVEMLQPAKVAAPQAGRVTDLAKIGEAIRQNGTIAKLEVNGSTVEVRSPIAGRVRSFAVARGAQVQAGSELAMIDPAPEQVWEALRALYLVGQKEDLPAVQRLREEPAQHARSGARTGGAHGEGDPGRSGRVVVSS